MRRPNAQRVSLWGARKDLAKSAATLAAVLSACTFAGLGGACGDPSSSTSTGTGGGSSSSSGGQGGEGLMDFVTSASSSSSSSSSGTGGSGPVCAKPDPTGGASTFAKNYGDANTQSGVAVSVDKAGNILLAGAFQGSMDLGGGALSSAGKEDIFIAKFSPTGQLMWSKRFGDGSNQSATGIGADADGNVIVTGIFIGNVDFGGGTLTSNTIFFQDVFIAKFNADGGHVWSKKFGDSNIQYARSLAVDSIGNVVIAGHFQNDVDFGGGTLTSAGLFDAFVAKFNAAGQHQWSKRYGDATDQVARSVTVDGTGNVYVAGEAAGSIDFGAGAVPALGTPSAFVAKLDPQGLPLWSKVSDGQGKASARSVSVGPMGEVAVGGSFQGTFDLGGGKLSNLDLDDAFVSVFSASGVHTYTKRFGDAALQSTEGVAVTSNGDVLFAGSFTGDVDFGGGPITSQGGFDVFLGRLDAKGCVTWGRIFGGPTVQTVQSIVLDAAMDRAHLTGSFNGAVDFGMGPLTAAGDDAFLLTVNP